MFWCRPNVEAFLPPQYPVDHPWRVNLGSRWFYLARRENPPQEHSRPG